MAVVNNNTKTLLVTYVSFATSSFSASEETEIYVWSSTFIPIEFNNCPSIKCCDLDFRGHSHNNLQYFLNFNVISD